MRQRGRTGLWLLAALSASVVGWWYFAPPTLPAMLRRTAPTSPKAQNASPPLYKWRDAKGQLHVTDVAPADRPYETVRYDPNTNVVPAYGTPKNE